jgi:hypothetical protein
MDWGFKHHSSIHWHTTGDVMPEEALMFGKVLDKPKKFVFTYREKVISLAQEGGDEEGLAAQIGLLSKVRRSAVSSSARMLSERRLAQILLAKCMGKVLQEERVSLP